MLKVSEPSEDHRHPMLIAKVDGVLIFNGTTRLYHCPNAVL